MHNNRHSQRGAVLIIALIMLVLITMVSMATVRGTTLDERMAGNARDRDKALQAAEGAVRTCLKQLTVDDPTTYTGTILDPVASGTAENWDIPTNWENSNSVAVDLSSGSTSNDPGLASQPRCMVERLAAGDNYRVTGRAVGGSANSLVILQATYTAAN